MKVDAFIQAFRPWAEALGFLKDIVLAAAVLYGLRQVVLTKQSIDLARKQAVEDQQRSITEHERAAKTVTLESAKRFVDEFGAKYVAYIQECAPIRLMPYGGETGDFRLASLPMQARSEAYRRSQLRTCGAALDQLEVFAAAHLYGVADEEVGFALNGRMFCAAVSQDFYDVLCLEREQGFYEAIVDLFNLWSSRLDRAKLTKSKELIELQRAEVDKQMEQLPQATRVRPIGARPS